MRVTHVENAVRGLLQAKNFYGVPVVFERPVERIQMVSVAWKIRTAITGLHWLMTDCERLCKDDREVRDAAARVQARCRELYTYPANDMDSLSDYGRQYRNGLPISSSRAEGCVDDIGNTRMGTLQRMRWSPKGAHLVAIVRATVLDGRLTSAYHRAAA